jgi:hypothetical protein
VNPPPKLGVDPPRQERISVDKKQIAKVGLPRGPPERLTIRTTRQLGSLIAAAFEHAGQRTTDPKEVLRLATESVLHVLRRARMQKTTRHGYNRLVVEERK